jgi:hypothetical protein
VCSTCGYHKYKEVELGVGAGPGSLVLLSDALLSLKRVFSLFQPRLKHVVQKRMRFHSSTGEPKRTLIKS